MSDFVFLASPISWNRIAHMADSLRQELGLENTKYFPVIEVLENVLDQQLGLVRIEVEEDKLMGSVEAFTDPAGEFIRFSESVYKNLNENQPRARWTGAHEAGHFFLHTRKPLTRVVGARAIKEIKPFQCPERQAHQFAAELLMPRKFIDPATPMAEIMRDFGVSEEAATKRKKFIVLLRG